MKDELKKYLAEIGSKGGKKSRRTITPTQQAAMQEARKVAKLRKGTNSSPTAGSEQRKFAKTQANPYCQTVRR